MGNICRETREFSVTIGLHQGLRFKPFHWYGRINYSYSGRSALVYFICRRYSVSVWTERWCDSETWETMKSFGIKDGTRKFFLGATMWNKNSKGGHI